MCDDLCCFCPQIRPCQPVAQHLHPRAPPELCAPGTLGHSGAVFGLARGKGVHPIVLMFSAFMERVAWPWHCVLHTAFGEWATLE